MIFDLLTFCKKDVQLMFYSQRNGRNVIDIGVNEGLLGDESSMKMDLPFDHAEKIH